MTMRRAFGRQIIGLASIAALVLAPAAGAQNGPRERPRDAGDHDDGSHTHQPPSEMKIVVEGDFRVITANGVPDHPSGHRNPGRVEAQQYRFRVPLKPKPADRPTPLRHAPFGVAVNGVVFDPSTNEFWNGDRAWMYDALSGKVELGMDVNHAHVQPGGKYHYHGLPTTLLKRLGGDKKMVLVGYAADGFPVYGPLAHADPNDATSPLRSMKPSYRLKRGTRPAGADGPGGKYDGTFFADWEYAQNLGDLDDCNARTGVTPEYPEG
ncbi:MAG TPA: YHYH protein, partial [Tepidisphaeraceae bacterium]